MRIKVHHKTPPFDSYRIARIKSLFNVEERGGSFDLEADLPNDTTDWQIGLIVGPSGSGKTSIGKRFWLNTDITNLDDNWPKDRPIIDAIAPDAPTDQATRSLASVGLGDVPAWLRPFHVLSTGEKFRAGLARLISNPPERIIVDEFTSVLDRQVAKTGSMAFSRAWRRGKGQALILSCHRDIIPWLRPDWIYDTASGDLISGRSLRRPQIKVEIFKTGWQYWPLFEPHHFLRLPNMIAACTYVGFIGDTPVCHAGVTTHLKTRETIEARIARIVVMPEWQGIGLGHRLVNQIADWCLHGTPEARLPGRPMTTLINTSHPGFAATLRSDPKWRQITQSLYGSKRKITTKIRSSYGGHFRGIQGFRYIGE